MPLTIKHLTDRGDLFAVNNGDSTEFISTDPQKVLDFIHGSADTCYKDDSPYLQTWIDIATMKDGIVRGGFSPDELAEL